MVSSCSIKGCGNTFGAKPNIHFHAFPLNDSIRLNTWMTAINRMDGWKPSKFSRVCSEHFTADSYKPGSSFRLKNDAVPSIFGVKKANQMSREFVNYYHFETDNVISEEINEIIDNDKFGTEPIIEVERINSYVKMETEPIIVDNFLNSNENDKNTEYEIIVVPNVSNVANVNSQFSYHVPNSTEHDYCISQPERLTQTKFTQTKEKDAPEKLDILRRKIKTLQRLLQRRNKNMDALKAEVKQLKIDVECARTYSVGHLPPNCPTFVVDLLQQQMQLTQKKKFKKKNGRRYTESIRNFALTLHYCSPRAYEFVAQHIPLPSPHTIKVWLNEALMIGEDQLSPISDEDVVCVGEVEDFEDIDTNVDSQVEQIQQVHFLLEEDEIETNI